MVVTGRRSAGGEQPKFTISVCDTPEQAPRAIIVEFSPKLTTPVGRRWADLLQAEHIANQVLREAGFTTAHTRTLHIEERIFLESERFDRIGYSGRRGLVSLRALDAAYIGQGSAQRIPLWLFGFLREKHTRIPQHSKSPQVSGQVSKQAGLQIVAA